MTHVTMMMADPTIIETNFRSLEQEVCDLNTFHNLQVSLNKSSCVMCNASRGERWVWREHDVTSSCGDVTGCMSVVSYAHSQVQTLQEEIKGHLETNILFKLTINLDKKNQSNE